VVIGFVRASNRTGKEQMTEDYGTHVDYMRWVRQDADTRQVMIEAALRDAFSAFVEIRDVEVILFFQITVDDLASALSRYPNILKSLLHVCNLGARAIERDLGLRNINTFSPRLSSEKSAAIAGYIKPFLPTYVELPTLSCLDRVAFVDKEIRSRKGKWEIGICEALNNISSVSFCKRKFESGGEFFEIDAASPVSGSIELAVDVKRIEARRDIHKRCDEIVNKASKLKAVYPNAQFIAIIYYPFIDEQLNVQNRLRSNFVDHVFFAAESQPSIDNAVRLLLARLGADR
jgi:hypothetical protein